MSRPSRRRAREAALQLLYREDLSGEAGSAGFWETWPEGRVDGATREFAEFLVAQVHEHSERIDAAIEAASRNWDLERFSKVDLHLVRLAVGELVGSPEVPAPVVINEAVEIAHRYSDERAASFVNGVLDRVARDSGRLAASPGGGRGAASDPSSEGPAGSSR